MNFSRRSAVIAITLALIFGAVARVGTVRWGDPYLLHVDERGYVMLQAAATEWRGLKRNDWRPRITTYGPVLFATALGVKWTFLGGIDAARRDVAHHSDAEAYVDATYRSHANTPDLVGWTHLCRLLLAWLSSLSLVAFARASWLMGGPRVAVFATWLAAASAGLIQQAHFFTSDGLAIVEIGFLMHACALMMKRPRIGPAVYAGIAMGLLAATRLSAAFLLIAVPVAIAAAPGARGVFSPASPLSHGALRILGALISLRFWVFAATTRLVMTLLNPWSVFQRDLYESVPTALRGSFVLNTQYTDHDYTFYDWRFSYNDRIDHIYELTAVLPWALGTLALLAAIGGLLSSARRTAWPARVALALSLPTFLFVGEWGVKTIRYSTPIFYALCLAAALGLETLARRGRRSWLGSLLIGLTLISTIAWGGAYTWTMTKEDPRVAAGRWLASQIEADDIIALEPETAYSAVWGDRPEAFRAGQVVYLWRTNPEQAEISSHLQERLSVARYLVVGDWYRRRATHPRAPARAPGQAIFYEALFAGTTGFELVATFDNTPSIGPLRFDERGAEALSVCFDHMPVWIFERRGPYQSPFEPR